MNRSRLRRRLYGGAWIVAIWTGTLFWSLWIIRWPVSWWEGTAWVLGVGAVAGLGAYGFEHSRFLWRAVTIGSTARILTLRVGAYIALIGGSILGLSLLPAAPAPPCLHLPGLDPDPCRIDGAGLQFWDAVRIATLAGTMTLMAIVLNFGRELGSVVSPRTLVKLLFELHRRPVVEHRVFMFLDLDGSTALAEQLGPVGFALFKADFFRDLSDPVYATGGRILEYAGDEALLTWLKRDGRGVRAAATCYFAFQDLIQTHSGRYMERHGHLPRFKAALAAGEVVSMTIGDLRTQPVFSGDPLNVAGRLLSRCHEMEAQVLIPARLAHHLELLSELTCAPRGPVLLRGMEEPIEVGAVGRAETPLAEG
jgi:class 3 adenylate cyclase